MAKVQLSPFLTSISGKVGNAVFVRSGSSTFLRSLPSPKVSISSNQALFLRLFTQAQYAWDQIPLSQFLFLRAFISYFPRYSSNSKSIGIQAMNHFKTCKVYSMLAGQLLNNTVEFDNVPNPLSIISLVSTINHLTVNFNRTVNSTEFAFVYCGKVKPYMANWQSIYTSYMQPSSFSLGTSEDIYDSYIARFGRLPVVGEKIWIGCIGVNFDTYHITDYFLKFITVT
jgi:hypothetical protein